MRGIGIDPMNLAAGPKNEGRTIGRPGHIGIDSGDRPGFLNILIEVIINFAFFARHQILDIELGFGAFATHKGDQPAIGGRSRAHRTAKPLGHGCDFTRV